jgi:hypothetical protein
LRNRQICPGPYRAAFGALGKTEVGCAEQDEILRRMLAYAYQGRSTESLEVLIWQTHADRLPMEFDAVVGQAREWLKRAGLDTGGRRWMWRAMRKT